MYKIRKYKSYEFRLMPNLDGDNQLLEKLKFGDGRHLSEKHFSYVYFKGNSKVKIMTIPTEVFKFIQKSRIGYIGNRRGNFLSNLGEDVESYYGINNRSKISLDITDFPEDTTPIEYFDIVKYKPFNFYSIQEPRLITFDTSVSVIGGRDFLKIDTIGFVEDEPLYDGGDKDKIFSLYDDVPKISETIEILKKNLTIE